MKKYWILLLVLQFLDMSLCTESLESIDNELDDVMIKEADLRVDFRVGNRTFNIEGFRSNKNDEIIQNNKTHMFSQLAWYSIGYPVLVNEPDKDISNSSSKFSFTKDGFDLYIQMLTDEQKDALQKKVSSMYKISVDKSQILSLIPSRVSCIIELNCEISPEKIILRGTANDLRKLPMKMSFFAPLNTIERKCLEIELAEARRFDIICQIQKNSKSEFFAKSFVFEENEMDEEGKDLQHDLTKLTVERVFEQFPIEEDLKSYNSEDLKPELVQTNFAKWFKVKTEGDKDKKDHMVENNLASNDPSKEIKKNKNKFKRELSIIEKTKRKIGDVWFKQQFTLENQEPMKYKFMRAKLIDKSLEPVKKVETDSLLDCVDVCEKDEDCHYLQFNYKGKCELFDQKGVMYLTIDDSSGQSRLYQRLIYAEYEIRSFKLNNYFKQIFKTPTHQTCWIECLKVDKCQAATYDRLNSTCFLADNDLDGYNVSNDFITITFKQNINRFNSNRKLYQNEHVKMENTKLVNNYEISQISSLVLCWNKCIEDNKCVAISHKHNECLLYGNGSQIYKQHADGWITVSYQNRNFEFMTQRYENTKLFSHFKTVTTSLETECLTECSIESECVAISHKYNVCLLYGNLTSQVRQHLDGWVTVSYDPRNVDLIKYYPKTQIQGLRLALNSSSEMECWLECRQRSEWCVAVSYGEGNRCHLIAKGEYQRGRYDQWSTIYIDAASPTEFPLNPSYSLFRNLTRSSDAFFTLSILHNGNLVSGSGDNTIKIWNIQDGTLISTLYAHTNWILALTTLYNGNIVSGSIDNAVNIWENNQIEKTLVGHIGFVRTLALLPNTDFVGGSSENSISKWSWNGDYKLTIENAHNDSIRSLFVLPNGNLASGGQEGIIKVWNLETEELIKELSGHTDAVTALNILDNGMMLSGSDDNTLRVWDVDGNLLHTFTFNTVILTFAKLPNGDFLIPTNNYNIDIKSQDQLASGSDQAKATIVTGHTRPIWSIAVFSNGDFASASEDGTIEIWKRQ